MQRQRPMPAGTDEVIEFFDLTRSFLAPCSPACAAVSKAGNPCRNTSVVRLVAGPRCIVHLPRHVKGIVAEQKIKLENLEAAKNDRWSESVEERILFYYSKAEPYRRVPPPEAIAHALLNHLQGGRCFMCLCMGRGGADWGLVEDHCHETGMVRALLCRSCNSLEGKAARRPWHVYREYAPANGWYYRYEGMKAEWQPGDPDPLPNRMKMNIDLLAFASSPVSYVQVYAKAIVDMPATSIPETCRRRFDSGRPVLLPGERYARRNEMLRAQGWPIVRDDP